MMFKDRIEAGEKLGEELVDRGIDADIVLAIPRGGLPVGKKVSEKLGVELDVIAASKIGAPGNPELGMGGVVFDGTYWLDRGLIERSGAGRNYVRDQIQHERSNAREKMEFMRGDKELYDIKGKNIVLVDDGVATGSTAIPSLKYLNKSKAGKIVFAVPVGPSNLPENIRREADQVIILNSSDTFGSVGTYYEDFSQVSDKEAREYLKA